MVKPAATTIQARPRTRLLTLSLILLLAGCSQWSWNPAKWDLFDKKAEAPPPPVEMLTMESHSANPAGEKFEQHWDGARLVGDIRSADGVGEATLKPRDQRWHLRLAFSVRRRG